ncbi:uncharacterized protein MKS88_000084 [Plasmodium brasilianum]|uniref:uncharacterized protein n=1 Tax=Plasmodium brasilianum TaxID=5824 RepID=UPI00350E4892|nr:hypothetical protein MKS88_000084 [Plasmodium brasilianum]
MEQVINSLLFKKISKFILLNWICRFYVYVSTHNKTLYECYNHRTKLYTRNFRLLEIYEQDKNSSYGCLKEDIENGIKDKKYISNNEKRASVKKKLSNGSLPKNARCNKKDMKNKSCIFETKEYSQLEKKIFKELDYIDFLKRNRTISKNIYKKIISKKYGLRFALPLLLLLVLSLSFILDKFGGYGLANALYNIIHVFSPVSDSTIVGTVYDHAISPAIKSLHIWLTNSPLSWLFNTVVKLEKAGATRYANYCFKVSIQLN